MSDNSANPPQPAQESLLTSLWNGVSGYFAEPTPQNPQPDEDKDTTEKPAQALQTTGMLTKDQLLRIFAKFKAIVNSPAGKQRLKDAVKAGKDPEDETTAIQKEIAVALGIDGEHCMNCFREVMKTYQQTDPSLCQQFALFLQTESLACDEAEMTPEAFAQKVAQMNAARQQQMAMMQQMQQAGVSPQQHMEMMQRLSGQMQQMMQNSDVRAQMQKQAKEHFAKMQQQNPGVDPQQVMAQAMQKMAAATKLMEENGIDKEAVLARAIQQVAQGNTPNLGQLAKEQHDLQQQQQQPSDQSSSTPTPDPEPVPRKQEDPDIKKDK
eukprot:m.264409 g.264409  ORF g.264409 m.264409 type:complete len:323 (+) comp27807_c0_seq1:82-1050(+)